MTNEQKNEHARINGHCRFALCDCGGILPDANGSRDGTGASDHDAPYTFGRPVESYLTLRQHARLIVFRDSKLNWQNGEFSTRAAS